MNEFGFGKFPLLIARGWVSLASRFIFRSPFEVPDLEVLDIVCDAESVDFHRSLVNRHPSSDSITLSLSRGCGWLVACSRLWKQRRPSIRGFPGKNESYDRSETWDRIWSSFEWFTRLLVMLRRGNGPQQYNMCWSNDLLTKNCVLTHKLPGRDALRSLGHLLDMSR